MHQPLDINHLAYEIVRHRFSVNLVFLKLLMPESRPFKIERHGEHIRLLILHYLIQHGVKAVYGIRRLPF